MVTCAACALTPSVQVTQRTSGIPMRTVVTNNGRAQHVSTLLESRKPRRRYNKSLLFYTYDPSSIQDGEVNDVANSSIASLSSSSTLPIDFDRVQHNEVLNMITHHVEEEFDAGGFFAEEDICSSYAGSSKLSVKDASIDSSYAAPTKNRSASSSSSSSSATTTTKITAVSETRQIINEVTAIALPSLGGMLLDPIMSLIDTACVGQISTTSLAAMAPCVIIPFP
jgi:hypothetical protein